MEKRPLSGWQLSMFTSYEGHNCIIFKWWSRPLALVCRNSIIHIIYTYDNFCIIKIKYIVLKFKTRTRQCCSPSYMSVGVLLKRGKHLHARIISIRGQVWSHKPSIIPTFIPSACTEQSCICVSGVSFLSLFPLDCRTVPAMCFFFLFCFIILQTHSPFN